MSFCFSVEYLNVKVIRSFRDAYTPYLDGLYHIHFQLRSSLYNSYSTLWSAVRGIKHEEGVVERPNTARGEAGCCIVGSRPRPSSALFRRHSTYKACSN